MKGSTDEQRDVQLAAASSGGAYAAGARPGPRSYQQPGDARRAPDDGEPQRVLPALTPFPRPPQRGAVQENPRPRSPSRRPGSRAVRGAVDGNGGSLVAPGCHAVAVVFGTGH